MKINKYFKVFIISVAIVQFVTGIIFIIFYNWFFIFPKWIAYLVSYLFITIISIMIIIKLYNETEIFKEFKK
jgi:hypothetical protein